MVTISVFEPSFIFLKPRSPNAVILSHGFPYDVHAFNVVPSILTQSGARVIAPYIRGFGPTRFVSPDVMSNGQQLARGLDIVQLSDALGLDRSGF